MPASATLSAPTLSSPAAASPMWSGAGANRLRFLRGRSTMTPPTITTATDTETQEKKRTVVAIVSASIISLLVWGLVVVLNVH
jgi:hypothetical protein